MDATEPTTQAAGTHKLSLKVDVFRRSLRGAGAELRRGLLLQTVASTDASTGALYLSERDEIETFGPVRTGPLRRRLARRIDAGDRAPGSLLIDGDALLAAPVWRRGRIAGALCVGGRQWDAESDGDRDGFSEFDRALLLALAATASIALDRELLERENERLRRHIPDRKSVV